MKRRLMTTLCVAGVLGLLSGLVCAENFTLEYSTYLGGSDTDVAYSLAVDSSSCVYVVGQSWSTDFPTQNAYQAVLPGFGNVVISKFSPDGASLVYSTYLGGSVVDEPRGIAVDSSNCAYIAGYTISHDFPTTANAYQSALGGGFGDFDAFVCKLSANGSSLLFSTYLGGSDPEQGGQIAVDSAGCAYVVGMTYSTDFPTQNAYQATLPGSSAAFVTKFTSDGSALVYSTYLGGSSGEAASDVAVGESGCAYVTGYTESADFPTQNPYQETYGGGNCDAFITKLTSSGNALTYSTYLGGSDDDRGNGIAVDGSGNAYVTGYTASAGFPTQNPYQGTNAGNEDAFITKLTSSGNALTYSTCLGGSGDDRGNGIAVDGSGNTYVTGYTVSSNFPTQDPYQGTHGGGFCDAFITKLTSSGDALTYSTYLGGSDDDRGNGIAVDGSGNAYVTGYTASSNFPTQNPYQGTYAGGIDAFVAKLSEAPTVTTQPVTGIGATTATGNGNITDLGAPNPTAHGVCWNTTGTPTLTDSHTDEGVASATGSFTSAMTGLLANTTYYVRAYATNIAGTAYGAQVSFETDLDGTGVPPDVQDAGPNGGDGNGDGIMDSKQTTVASLPSATSGDYLTVEITGCDQIEQVQAYTYESVGASDPGYSYPFGLLGFEIPCPSATVRIYYHGADNLEEYIYRKYGPTPDDWNAPLWYTMPAVTFGTEDIGGETVPYVEFNLTEGQLGDDTNVFPIVDQGGPAQPIPAPIPTLNEWGMIMLFLFMAGAAFIAILRRKQRNI